MALPSTPRPLSELLRGYASAPDLAVTGVEMDSRRIQRGQLFLACKGHAKHGLAFLHEAIERGAAAVAWEPTADQAPPRTQVPAIAVESLSARAGEIAARFWGHPSSRLFTVGITGTDGKTSTAHLVAQALEQLDEPCAYVGTLGAGRVGKLDLTTHTTPDPIELQRLLAGAVHEGLRCAAMEVSSHALDQDRVSGVEFDVGVLTNIGRDHLDYHGDVERYAAAKHRLFVRPGLEAVVLNRDDAYGRAWAAELGGRAECIVYGLDQNGTPVQRHVLGRNLNLHADGLDFEVASTWGRAQLHSRLLGRFNAYNLLAALATLLVKGVELGRAVEALGKATTVPGRIEGFRGPNAAPLVVVDYAHTPQALEQVLTALRAHTRGKLYCVFGCGGDRDRGKRPLMGAAAVKQADIVVVTDDNPRSEQPETIARDIVAGMPAGHAARVIHDRATAITMAVREASRDDVVLIAGKGHESTQIYGGESRSFSDRDFVRGLVGAGA
jgi:UDP-N-acetylmuramoyl-L-alanyl-D-glutamate--2,6-diaminopimelate ligase